MKTSVLEIDAIITSPYGERVNPLDPTTKDFHFGVDLVGATTGDGLVVKAARGGIVAFTGFDPDGGNWILIQHDDGSGSRYFHLNAIYVAIGQRVSGGEMIGLTGGTGNVTGAHLHFEWLLNWNDLDSRVDPLPYILIDSPMPPTNQEILGYNIRTATWPAGLGLSNIAAANGLPIATTTYERIYNLTVKYAGQVPGINLRGAQNWVEMNIRAGAGDVVVIEETPVVPSIPTDPEFSELEAQNAKLKGDIEENKKKMQEQIAQVTMEARTQIETIKAQSEAQISVLADKIKSYQDAAQVHNLSFSEIWKSVDPQVKEVAKKVSLNLAQQALVAIHNLFQRVPKQIRPAAYILAALLCAGFTLALAGFNWQAWVEANPGTVAMAITFLGSFGAFNQLIYVLNLWGEDFKKKALSSLNDLIGDQSQS